MRCTLPHLAQNPALASTSEPQLWQYMVSSDYTAAYRAAMRKHAVFQKLTRTPNRKTRSSTPSRPVPVVVVITLNPPRFLTEPSGFNCRLDTFADGLEKCGVFVKFKASARNCALKRSVIRNSRKSEKSRLTRPGPRKES